MVFTKEQLKVLAKVLEGYLLNTEEEKIADALFVDIIHEIKKEG